jgi:hypothetical protein
MEIKVNPSEQVPGGAKFQYAPLLVIDMNVLVEHYEAETLDRVERPMWDYRRRGYVIACVANVPEVALGTTTIPACLAATDGVLKAFDNNPIHVVKYSYFHEFSIGPVDRLKDNPFNRKSWTTLPDIGLLCVIESELWSSAIAVNIGSSLAVGRDEMQKLAENAGIDFCADEDFFSGS